MSLPLHLCVFEASADAYAAALLRELRNRHGDAIAPRGFGGPALAAEGCQLWEATVGGSAMLLGVLRKLAWGRRALRRAKLEFRRAPGVVVLVDSSFVNLRIARIARREGLPVLYYVAPQVWASRPSRMKQLARDCDAVACIFGFEEPLLRQAGVRATFVGHPLWELEQAASPGSPTDPWPTRQTHDAPLRIAILPGSRRHVIRENLPHALGVAEAFAATRGPACFRVIAANEACRAWIEQFGGQALPRVQAQIAAGPAGPWLANADAAIVTSGTATLVAALHGCPMVVVYAGVSRLAWWLVGRHLVHTRFLSLPNILAGRALVPEFMPCWPGTAPVLEALLGVIERRQSLRSDLLELTSPLRCSGTSQRVADLVEQLAGLREPLPGMMDRPALR